MPEAVRKQFESCFIEASFLSPLILPLPCAMQYLDKAGRAPHAHPHRPVVEVLQTLTDVTNWSTIKQAAHTAAATIAPLFGMRLLGGFKAAPTRLVAGLKASK